MRLAIYDVFFDGLFGILKVAPGTDFSCFAVAVDSSHSPAARLCSYEIEAVGSPSDGLFFPSLTSLAAPFATLAAVVAIDFDDVLDGSSDWSPLQFGFAREVVVGGATSTHGSRGRQYSTWAGGGGPAEVVDGGVVAAVGSILEAGQGANGDSVAVDGGNDQVGCGMSLLVDELDRFCIGGYFLADAVGHGRAFDFPPITI